MGTTLAMIQASALRAAVEMAAGADPARVEMIRWTGYAFIAFGVAYLAYRWFSDR